MQLVVVGSGTAVPQKDRGAPCCLLLTEEGNVLLDLGPGSIYGVARHARITVREVDVVLISHLHMDHCADLAPLLFAHRASELARTAPLHVMGPPGLKDHFHALKTVWEHSVEPAGFDLLLKEHDGRGEPVALRYGELQFRAAPTEHSQFNLAWRIDGPDEKSVLFTGDGEATRALIELGNCGPHVLVCECAAGPGENAEGHMNPRQAGELAAMCGSDKLVLTHINPGIDPEDLIAHAKNQFDGEVIVAEDGMVISIS